jgi:hypothetical protein
VRPLRPLRSDLPMKLSRIIAVMVEGTFDLLLAVPLIVIASTHRWLDATLWAIALVGLVGAIWLASKRRRSG